MNNPSGNGSNGQYPTFYNESLGLRYRYDQASDEIVYETDLRIRRPPEVPRESLTGERRSTPRTAFPPSYNHGIPQSYPPPNSPHSYSYSLGQTDYTQPGPSAIPFSRPPRQSPPMQRPDVRGGQPSSPGRATQPTLNRAFASMSMSGQGHTGSQHVRVTRARRTSHGFVPQVYTTPAAIRSDLSDAPEEEQKLFSSFKRRKSPRTFFVVGKVFLTLWSEPAGESGTGGGSTYTAITSNGSGISQGRWGERVYSKIRRFIVVREGNESCTALPIITYNGQGVSRRGVRKSDHAIIHTSKHPPLPDPREAPVRGEDGMLSRAIRIDVDVKTDKLDEMSRVDFGKVYTIEHNVKVKSLGKVNRDSLQALLYQLKAVWASTVGLPPQNQQLEASSTVAEWIHAYQALVSSGFSDERARAILRSQPQRLRQVRDDVPAEELGDEEGESEREGADDGSEDEIDDT